MGPGAESGLLMTAVLERGTFSDSLWWRVVLEHDPRDEGRAFVASDDVETYAVGSFRKSSHSVWKVPSLSRRW